MIYLSKDRQAVARLGDYAFLANSDSEKENAIEKLCARELYNVSLNADLVTRSSGLD